MCESMRSSLASRRLAHAYSKGFVYAQVVAQLAANPCGACMAHASRDYVYSHRLGSKAPVRALPPARGVLILVVYVPFGW